MSLSKESKDELRTIIKDNLKNIPDGQQIHLNKDILEFLLFDEIVVNQEKNLKMKIPVWSGEFLRKIDLSEVDFTDVSWQVFSDSNIRLEEIECDDDFNIKIMIIKENNKNYTINYSYTNAVIDLTKSFEAKNCNKIYLMNCNFKGLNLQNQDFTKFRILYACNSDLSDTNLSIPNRIFSASCSNLSNIDLSNYSINGIDSISGAPVDFYKCSLLNTKINIEFNPYEYKLIIDDYINNKSKISLHKLVLFNKLINDAWIGCYLNGKKITKQKTDIFESVKNDIKRQIKRL